ncbi:hypothetical protein Ahu01nite_000730 [Winogradskya humida]|uniref:Uncharacterized protein n=1 Tax=Winogradskya humida TaxID=113566 RepID=A0ABQ3ZEG6_9ACTN|nr:hypothetical protein Ahu01nite_000730 [Actinoplanes humidus]
MPSDERSTEALRKVAIYGKVIPYRARMRHELRREPAKISSERRRIRPGPFVEEAEGGR